MWLHHDDHISEQNPFFCELKAGYWIWKNDIVHDGIGLFHYSRGLDLDNRKIEAIVHSDIDVVLPAPLERAQEMACVLSCMADEYVGKAHIILQ